MIEYPIYTWVDVQAALEDLVPCWPTALYSARAYWDGLSVEHADGGRAACEAWLADQFGPRWLSAETIVGIRLESRTDGPERVLPVTLDAVTGEEPRGAKRRSFRPPDTAMRRDPVPDEDAVLQPKVFAWHSFKGGVGRTTTAVQFGRLLAAQPGTSVMLVDMDFEAPGITWMTAASRLPTPSICMADVLALFHATHPDEHDEVVALIVERLRDLLVDGLVILPALRASQRDADIRPEHLELAGGGSLANVLKRIGAALQVTHVICDLRAGRSELAASLLLDRRVNRVLVTSCGGQSVKGAVQMLEDLSDSFPLDTNHPPITVVISKVESPSHFDYARDSLQQTTEQILARAAGDPAFPVRFTAALMSPSLLTLPLDWVDVTAHLDGNPVFDVSALGVDMTIPEWAASESPGGGLRPAPRGEATPTPVVPEALPLSVDERRRRLEAFTRQMIVAEGAGAGPLLPAEFLKKLAHANRYRLPIAVVVGEKGAGKTFTYMRLVTSRGWQLFTRALIEGGASIDGAVTPVVWPGSLQDNAKQAMNDILGGGNQADGRQATLTSAMREAKAHADENFDWRRWWLDRLIASAGRAAEPDLGRPFADGRFPLFVVDGLEELLPNVRTDPTEQRCLRALLQEIPAWIRGAGWQVGLLVFVRSDYVHAAIPQNTEQFLAQYRSYELWWDHHQARELVGWAAAEARAVDASAPTAALDLRPIWGATTGPGVSPAAPMDAWVMDAMSPDRRSDAALKARDVIRLLAEASRLSIGRGEEDRLLSWSALLAALDVVGKAKVDELRQQHRDPTLARALERIGALGMRIPLRYEELSQEQDRLALLRLENEGIAWRERGDVWLLPLYRRGLELSLSPRRRERVLRERAPR